MSYDTFEGQQQECKCNLCIIKRVCELPFMMFCETSWNSICSLIQGFITSFYLPAVHSIQWTQAQEYFNGCYLSPAVVGLGIFLHTECTDAYFAGGELLGKRIGQEILYKGILTLTSAFETIFLSQAKLPQLKSDITALLFIIHRWCDILNSDQIGNYSTEQLQVNQSSILWGVESDDQFNIEIEKLSKRLIVLLTAIAMPLWRIAPFLTGLFEAEQQSQRHFREQRKMFKFDSQIAEQFNLVLNSTPAQTPNTQMSSNLQSNNSSLTSLTSQKTPQQLQIQTSAVNELYQDKLFIKFCSFPIEPLEDEIGLPTATATALALAGGPMVFQSATMQVQQVFQTPSPRSRIQTQVNEQYQSNNGINTNSSNRTQQNALQQIQTPVANPLHLSTPPTSHSNQSKGTHPTKMERVQQISPTLIRSKLSKSQLSTDRESHSPGSRRNSRQHSRSTSPLNSPPLSQSASPTPMTPHKQQQMVHLNVNRKDSKSAGKGNSLKITKYRNKEEEDKDMNLELLKVKHEHSSPPVTYAQYQSQTSGPNFVTVGMLMSGQNSGNKNINQFISSFQKNLQTQPQPQHNESSNKQNQNAHKQQFQPLDDDEYNSSHNQRRSKRNSQHNTRVWKSIDNSHFKMNDRAHSTPSSALKLQSQQQQLMISPLQQWAQAQKLAQQQAFANMVTPIVKPYHSWDDIVYEFAKNESNEDNKQIQQQFNQQQQQQQQINQNQHKSRKPMSIIQRYSSLFHFAEGMQHPDHKMRVEGVKLLRQAHYEWDTAIQFCMQDILLTEWEENVNTNQTPSLQLSQPQQYIPKRPIKHQPLVTLDDIITMINHRPEMQRRISPQSVPPAVIEELARANRPRLDMEPELVGEDALHIVEICGVIDSIQGAKMKRLTLIQQKLK
ncbi:MAG: hypothetical protein EZS28_021073 [Streblomastix strix]|uniref:Uncharacterized protein n=1 Tax=Streblomastix strix TaxID=222440 RepID=A0A5J4VM27_9EUKA|nr:MAG: hypothetical protein EZS28_021073 [Streblomastix strix]